MTALLAENELLAQLLRSPRLSATSPRQKLLRFSPVKCASLRPTSSWRRCQRRRRPNDRGVKFDGYAAHGVSEYWLIDPDTQTVEQYRLHADVNELAIKAQSVKVHRSAVSGFSIPGRAIFDDTTNQATPRQLLAA